MRCGRGEGCRPKNVRASIIIRARYRGDRRRRRNAMERETSRPPRVKIPKFHRENRVRLFARWPATDGIPYFYIVFFFLLSLFRLTVGRDPVQNVPRPPANTRTREHYTIFILFFVIMFLYRNGVSRGSSSKSENAFALTRIHYDRGQ